MSSQKPLLHRVANAWDALRGRQAPTPPRRMRAVYAGARFDRNFQDWMASVLPADDEIKGDIRTLRMRSRQLSRDNEIAIAFEDALTKNVLGERGITLDSKFMKGDGAELDEILNKEIEAAWEEWAEAPTVDGTMSLEDVDDLLLRNTAIDGEQFVRMYDNFPNAHGFAIQVVDPDQVDENDTLNMGVGRSEVRMGIEVTPYGRPLAYRIHEDPRRAYGFNFQPTVVPAEDVIHFARRAWARANQTRFVTWYHGIMNVMHLLEGLIESECVSARNDAAASLIWEDMENAPAGEEAATSGDSLNRQTELAPGAMIDAPAGKKASVWHPNHPNQALPEFAKMLERRAASALRLAYITLANDVSEGSFANSRIAIGAERRRWKRDQRWMVRDLKTHVARRWFINVLRKRLFPADLLLSYPRNQVPFGWRLPTWEYGVNPLQDAQADVLRIQHRLASHEAVIEERGGVLEVVLQQEARAEKLAAKLDLELAPAKSPAAATDDEGAPDPAENGNGNGAKAKPARSPRSRLPAD